MYTPPASVVHNFVFLYPFCSSRVNCEDKYNFPPFFIVSGMKDPLTVILSRDPLRMFVRQYIFTTFSQTNMAAVKGARFLQVFARTVSVRSTCYKAPVVPILNGIQGFNSQPVRQHSCLTQQKKVNFFTILFDLHFSLNLCSHDQADIVLHNT